jgi:hypothetical protein
MNQTEVRRNRRLAKFAYSLNDYWSYLTIITLLLGTFSRFGFVLLGTIFNTTYLTRIIWQGCLQKTEPSSNHDKPSKTDGDQETVLTDHKQMLYYRWEE